MHKREKCYYLTTNTKSPLIDWLSLTRNTPLVLTLSSFSLASSRLSGPKYQLKQRNYLYIKTEKKQNTHTQIIISTTVKQDQAIFRTKTDCCLKVFKILLNPSKAIHIILEISKISLFFPCIFLTVKQLQNTHEILA